MKKHLLFLLCILAGLTYSFAQEFPETSNNETTKWYLIQFMNGGNAFTAASANAEITTSAAVGSDEQLWKITGNSTDGYRFTNKKGYTLYVGSAARDQKVHASDTPSGVCDFYINATNNSSYSGGYEIQPAGNTSVSMNLWGGPSENRGVGLWNSGDQNNPVQFFDATAYEEMGKISIIPHPAELTVTQEGGLNINTLSAVAYTGEKMKLHAEEFAAQLATSAGITLQVKEAAESAAEGEIWFGTDETLPAEGYTLLVNSNNIEIKAAGFAGWLYGLQTLKQMLPRQYFATEKQDGVEWSVPYLDIKDQPKLGHRGYMLDVARHFFNKEEVKKVLDILVLYKMNRFHWHLTDDQGWRVEIPEYPKLTEVGSIRSKSFSNIGDGQSFYDDTEYGRGMWFTQEDLKEVVEYALARNIEIMPEIDLPGHMVAAVTAYPEFSCDSTKEYSVRIDGGISKDVLNIGDDRVIDFLKCVIDNIANIFPHQYIHIGGDECPTDQWATNEQCLARVEELGLDGVHQLQSWLVEELGTYIKEKHGKDIVVWDELLNNWNDNNKVKPVIMAWNGIGYSGIAASREMKSIIVPYTHLYLDFMQSDENNRFVDEPYHGGWGINTVEEIYGLNPLSSLSGKEDYALGVQGNMWTETCNDIDEVEYQLLPRLLALSEIGWLPTEKKNWVSFYKRLQSHDEIFELLDYQYAKHYIEPTEYSEAESTIMEAESILENSIRGGVGYPAAEVYDALKDALAATESDDVTALQTAIDNYKSAEITLPTEGKTYQIVSASTYYKRQYEGSTMYQSDNGVRFHYTPQTEPEELWQFTATDNGYIMTNVYSGAQLQMASYNAAVAMGENGTAIRIDKATIATQNYTYIPGVVTISAIDGYNAAMTGSVKRLSAEGSGEVYAKDEAALCYNGTWKIVEVNDFTAQLAGLVNKCELIALNAKPGKVGQPSEKALEYLQDNVTTPATAAVADGSVTEQQYNAYVALYHQFQMMPRTSLAETIDTGVYYYIRNAYFTDKYAAYSNNRIEPKAKSTADNFLWSFAKNSDGTVYIYNKANGKAAYIGSDAIDQTIKVGDEYAWTLKETTTDTGSKGIAIVAGDGEHGWYTNPNAWGYLLTKPYTWGASVWTLEKSTLEVETGIEYIKDSVVFKGTFDLQGRKVEKITTSGIYLINGKKVFVTEDMIK